MQHNATTTILESPGAVGRKHTDQTLGMLEVYGVVRACIAIHSSCCHWFILVSRILELGRILHEGSLHQTSDSFLSLQLQQQTADCSYEVFETTTTMRGRCRVEGLYRGCGCATCRDRSPKGQVSVLFTSATRMLLRIDPIRVSHFPSCRRSWVATNRVSCEHHRAVPSRLGTDRCCLAL